MGGATKKSFSHFLLKTLRTNAEPTQVLDRYLKAVYARDFKEAYRWISLEDRRLKDEKRYVRERGGFSGFTLEVAKRLAGFIEVALVEKALTGDRATLKLQLRLPDANKLSSALLEWDEERLSALSPKEKLTLIQRLEQWHKKNKIPVIEGEENFALVREANGWRIFLNWAAGVRVAFHAEVRDSLPLEIKWDQQETLIRPGDLFNVHFRIKNRSDKEILTRIPHHVEPKAMREYLELVECGLFSPMKLLPGEQQEYSSTYLIRPDIPDGTRQFSVTYEFNHVP